jgi:hypothetical protein
MDDEQLIFLSDADESADENESSKDNEDRARQTSMDAVSSEDEGEDEGEDDEEESLNTDKRKEKLRKARLTRNENNQSFNGSMDPDAIAAMTKAQVLPFDIEPEDDLFMESHKSTQVPSTPRTPSKSTDSSRRITSSQAEVIDEYKDVMRRTKVIRDILDGVDECGVEEALGSPVRGGSSLFGLMDRIVDRTSLLPEPSAAESSAFGNGSSSHNDVDLTAIVRPRMLARQNSSFLSEDRRNHFLSTVGEDSRGSNASTRVVKEVNRRKMVFATSKKSASSGSFSASSSAAAATITTSTMTTTMTPTVAKTSMTPTALKNAGVQGASSGGSASSRLLQILSLEEE